jgi:hypothetical protein
MNRAFVPLIVVAALLLAGAAWYLHDPPWVADLTSGIRDWQTDPAGARFRWTAGRASFFIRSSAAEMTLPLRAQLPAPDGGPVIVRVSLDDRFLTDVVLTDPRVWVTPMVPLPRRPAGRRYRRVELRVSRTVGEFNLGVQLGEVRLQP